MEEMRPKVVQYFDLVKNDSLFSYDSLISEREDIISFVKRKRLKKDQMKKLTASAGKNAILNPIDAFIVNYFDCPKTLAGIPGWHTLEENRTGHDNIIEYLGTKSDHEIYEFYIPAVPLP